MMKCLKRLRYVIEVAVVILKEEGISGMFFAVIGKICPTLLSEIRKRKEEFLSQLLAIQKQFNDNVELTQSKEKKICILVYEASHINVVDRIIHISNYNVNSVEVVTLKHTQIELAHYLGDNQQKIGWVVIPAIKDNGSANNSIEKNALFTATSELVCILNRWDMIIIPTVENNIETYRPVVHGLSESTEVVVMLHNLNRCFENQKDNLEIRDLVAKASSYAVPHELLIEEMSRNNPTAKNIYDFSFAFRETPEHFRAIDNEKFIFVITGNVMGHRKDYELVMSTFSKLHEYYDRVELVLLGSAASHYGKRVIRLCKKMQSRGLSVHYYDTFVPTDIFQKTIRNADFLLGPIQKHYNFNDGTYETYNKTKLSGFVSDMIEYARPGIVPGYLRMPDRLKSSTIYYENPDDLRNVIISLLDRNIVRKYLDCALENSRKYALGKYLL